MPKYVPPSKKGPANFGLKQKPVNIESTDEFPSLGSDNTKKQVTDSKFSDMAKNWAKMSEDQEKVAQLQREKEIAEQKDLEGLKVKVVTQVSDKYVSKYEYNDYEAPYDEMGALGEEDYEFPTTDEEMLPTDEEEYEEEEDYDY
jgi:hypothetical protein